MPVEMELARIVITETNDRQVVHLKEVEGRRMVSIVMGTPEATGIDLRIKGRSFPRPLTLDVLHSTIERMGGELQDVWISELRGPTYQARLRIRCGGRLIEVDSRPSDAIALAIIAGAPIQIAETLIDVLKGESRFGGWEASGS